MARVLIIEPEPDLRLLVQEAVRELGHEALLFDGSASSSSVDVLLVAVFAGMTALVTRLRHAHAPLSVVCAGTMPAGQEVRALRPAAYLIKPYTLGDLERALIKASQTVSEV
jgi:CheY-like chemotaxis protein